MGVSLGIGALVEGAADVGAVAAADVGAGLAAADVGAGLAAADVGAGLAAADVGAGLGAAEAGLGAGAAEAGGLAAGTAAAELAAAGIPELAAPVEAGIAGATEAGALAPAAGALAPAVSPAVTGLSTVAGEALPAGIAEGAGVVPLTETAVETVAPEVTQAATQGVEQLGTQAATQGAEQLGTQAVTQGAEQLGTQAATQGVTQTAETGLSQLAPGAQQIVSDAAPLTSEAGAQTAVAQAGAQATEQAAAQGAGQAVTQAGAQATEQAAAQGAGQAVTQGAGQAAAQSTLPTFTQPGTQQLVQDLTQAESSLAPAAPASSALAPAAADAAAKAGGEGLTSSIGSLAGKAGSWLANNPMSVLSGLGLAYNMMKGQQPPKYSGQLSAEAAQLQAQGAQLQGYLTSGTLPPGIGSALSGAHDSAAAAIRSRYANMGMSGSSAEMQDLNNLAQTTVSQGADIANKLLATGVSEQQFASGLYQNLMATSMQQDKNMSDSISNFTNALARSSSQPKPV